MSESRGQYITILPQIYNELGSGPSPIEGQGQDPRLTLFYLIGDHPEQRREKFEWNVKLSRTAQEKARHAYQTKTYTHTDSSGHGPNWWAWMEGSYGLPGYYSDKYEANNIESMVMRRLTPQHAFGAWLNSPGHRAHLLGELDFYREQTQIGIGHVIVDSKGNGYWLFWSAHPER